MLSDKKAKTQNNTFIKVNRRIKRLRGDRPLPDLTDRTVLPVDDGLASGITLLTAIEAVREAGAASIAVAVPSGHLESIHRIDKQVDRVYCPNIRSGTRFAVADAYKDGYDVKAEALLELLREVKDNTNR